jgi:hypothetical protein
MEKYCMNLPRYWRYFCALLLVLTALAKFWGVGRGSIAAAEVDPVMDLPLRQLLFAVAVFELAVAVLLLARPFSQLGRGALLVFGVIVGSYRMISPDSQPCPCLGQRGAVLGVSLTTQSQLAMTVLVFLILSAFLIPLESKNELEKIHA